MAIEQQLGEPWYRIFYDTRDLLRSYFEKVRASLRAEGLFVLDLYGGPEAMVPQLQTVGQVVDWLAQQEEQRESDPAP